MNFVQILFNMHVNLSNSNTPPFTHIKEFDKEKINYELMDKIKNEDLRKYIAGCDIFPSERSEKVKSTQSILFSEDTQKIFSIECLELFKKKYPNMPFGSVHHNPVIWVIFVYNTIIKKINDKSENNTISYPNGCCSNSA